MHAQKDGKFYIGVAPGRGPHQRRDADRPRRPRREVRRRRCPAHRPPEAGRARRRRGRRRAARSPTSPRSTSRRGRRTGAAPRWPAPASSSASSRSSTPSSARSTWSPSWRSASPTSTPRSRVNVNGCPNACARTQVADIGLKGMLVLDDDGNQVEGFQVHLGGSLGLTERLRQEAARPQGHQRRPRRLRHHRGRQLPRRPRGRRELRRPGPTAPTRSCSAARRRSCMSAPRRAVPLPLLRRREPLPARGRATGSRPRRVGMPVLPAGVQAVSMIGQLRPPARTATHDGRRRRDDRPDTRSPRARAAARDTEGRSTEELQEIVSHVGAELELAPAEDIIEWAVATFGERFCVTSSMSDAVLSAPRLEGRARGRRRLPRHRLPLRRDHRHPRRRRGDDAGQPDQHHAGAVGGRAGRGVRQGPLQARPRPVLRAAQGAAAGRRRSRSTTPGPPACVAPRPTTG